MAETATKLPVGKEEKADRPAEWRPFESLRREVDRLFEDFQLGSWRSPFGRSLFDVQPFWRGEVDWGKAPAVDKGEGLRDHGGAAGDGREQYRRQVLRRHADD
jgi:HSP20 family protein